MDNSTRQEQNSNFVFSKALKAGKRIYYFDVRRTKNDDLYISITESKKQVKYMEGEGETETNVTFLKQRLLLYKEDFQNFINTLMECTDFVEKSMAEDDFLSDTNGNVTGELSDNNQKPDEGTTNNTDFDNISFDI